jgi:hypothetical protein
MGLCQIPFSYCKVFGVAYTPYCNESPIKLRIRMAHVNNYVDGKKLFFTMAGGM